MSSVGVPRTVEIEDHAEGLAMMKAELEIHPGKTALVTIDMHRGHLDMTHATMPPFPDDAGPGQS